MPDRATDPKGAEWVCGRTAWFNCSAGVAGDMLLAALIDAGASRLAVIDAWAQLDLDGFAATWERVDRAGVGALWTNFVIDHGDHDHDHRESGHIHRPARDVIAMIDNSGLPDRVRARARTIYSHLTAVEAAIHGQSPDEVELHEVGALDSILDVVGVCAALDDLNVVEVAYSPIGVGAGIVQTAHGALPHPAPATARLLAEHNAAVVGIATTMETATPTGVAVLTALGIGAVAPPAIEITAVGYGAGSADPDDRANVVQVLVGERAATQPAGTAEVGREGSEQLALIETNLDDVTGETIAYTLARLLEAGALDAWATPIIMKKRRPAHTVHVLGRPDQVDVLRAILTEETGSFGARLRYVDRFAAPRTQDTVDVDGHQIRIKAAEYRFKVEFDDAAAVAQATGQPLRLVTAAAEQAYRERLSRDQTGGSATGRAPRRPE